MSISIAKATTHGLTNKYLKDLTTKYSYFDKHSETRKLGLKTVFWGWRQVTTKVNIRWGSDWFRSE